jgi:Fic family protein
MLLLAKWKSLFAWIPMESVIYKNRPQYYKAIEDARDVNDSGAFIEFTLSAIYDVIAKDAKRKKKHQDKHQVESSDVQITILKLLETQTLSRKEIFTAIGMNSDSRSYKRHIEPLIEKGFVEMTVPDKPNSKLQKYRLSQADKNAVSIE